MKIKIKIVNKSNNLLPKYATPGSSGFDIMSNADVFLEPGDVCTIPTGLYVELPEYIRFPLTNNENSITQFVKIGIELQIRPRSGLSLKHNLLVANSPGTVDSDYRGEIKIIIRNIGNEQFVIGKGMKIAQGVLCPVFKAEFEEVDILEDTERGSGGFGSTGV